MNRKGTLLPIVRHFFDVDPLQAAHTLEGLPEEEAVEVLKTLPVTLAAKAFPHLSTPLAASLVQVMPESLFQEIITRMTPEQGADLFSHLPAENKKHFLELLPEPLKKEIHEILTYPADSAGRILSTDFVAFHQDLKIKEVIQKIRTLGQKGKHTSYTYVVDADNRLAGIINMRDLLLGQGDQTISEIMRRDLFTVNGFLDREKVANELSKRGFFAAPVVDNENRLLGVVRAEALIADVQEEASEDIQKMFGVGADERPFSSIPFSVKKRLPWLYVNLATAFLAAAVVALFESTIAKITVLAIFLPVVAGQGGNAGAQSLAVVMRGIVMREIPKDRIKNFLFKETSLGLINGLTVGLVTAVIAWAWIGKAMLGLVVGLAMLINLVFAGLAGASIPLTMKALGLDPAQCSNIILTTITDCLGFFAFLGLAVIFQDYLL
ncbi:MAG: magnesium transporter [Deltaproteobacteria bacterium]|nr:magnesium transporter [Deltaproteobacteria bacterium]